MTPPDNGGLQHTALFHRSHEEHRAGVTAFIPEALSRDEPALVAVPDPAIGPCATPLVLLPQPSPSRT